MFKLSDSVTLIFHGTYGLCIYMWTVLEIIIQKFMTEEVTLEPFFIIKRLTPDEAVEILNARAKKAKLGDTKSYNITNDDQRFELVRRVLNKELTIKEVSLPSPPP